jgi:polyisoprenoid-binding protein YceI
MNTTTTASDATTRTTTTTSRWTLDPGHSTVGFSVRHLMIANVRGEFAKLRADVVYDASRPEATRVEATIEVASLSTREPKRDDDLRGPLFFDAEHHPQMTFLSKSVHLAEEGVDVIGDLTVRGVTREVTLAVRDISAPQLDMRGKTRIGATASTKIKRSDFGMTWNKALETGGVVVGDVVTITIDVSLVKASS